ncbi:MULTISPECIES: hydrogen peroxide-dependent heme synthase [Corynebacterium]|uniref:Coproheme decarboxylase n=1 Tax=Corynebacterium singulare TaxID=161899 RepID=A0ABS9PT71_9CORY|nr:MULTISPECIES: hydrogen peroxide-dependent heme synthase [Corynebacterium]MCG7275224.1 chlorite dismutase family protein [Corynebacterium singulare]MCQ9676192.1 chlorite dismutase family protein [Corynebacterium sp. BF-R-2]
MSKVNFNELNKVQRYSQHAVFQVIPGALGSERQDAIAQAQKFFSDLAETGVVTVRGIYDLSGMRESADFMIWWHAEEFADIQKAFADFRRETVLGQVSEVTWVGNALHRPAEFNKSHLPSFIMGEEPGEWISVYPFVRSYDWYTMDEEKRRRILMEHGMQARDYPDVRANTVPAFALGDYEWILAFEAPELHRIVDLMYLMRYTEARHHVREEIPFHTGRRVKDVAELMEILP